MSPLGLLPGKGVVGAGVGSEVAADGGVTAVSEGAGALAVGADDADGDGVAVSVGAGSLAVGADDADGYGDGVAVSVGKAGSVGGPDGFDPAAGAVGAASLGTVSGVP
jgi:hypothetical protein